MNLPKLVDPGMPDQDPVSIRFCFDGMPWQGSLIAKTAGYYRELFAAGKVNGHLKYQTYELVPATDRQKIWWAQAGDSTNKSKLEAIATERSKMKQELKSKQNNDPDTLKESSVKRGNPEGLTVAQQIKNMKAGRASLDSGKASAKKAPVKSVKSGSNGKASGFSIRPGTNNDKVYTLLKDGKAHTRESVVKILSSKTLVSPLVAYLNKQSKHTGFKINALEDGEKFQLVKA